ncbi:MAG: UPF0149 family protein [Gammaproteobacteria bacterium]|nr:UPF0149 family protein [Gammaproteobacteria bacterium]
MTSEGMPSFVLIEGAMEELDAGAGVTEAHGSLCGLACVLGGRAAETWMASLAGAGRASVAGAAAAELLGSLATATCTALAEGAMAFSPLLPPDERPLAERTEALGAWCAGFMEGLGEVATSPAARAVLAGDSAREIIGDLAEIARATVGQAEASAEDEAAYTELVEFVRVSTQLLFEELHGARGAAGSSRLH